MKEFVPVPVVCACGHEDRVHELAGIGRYTYRTDCDRCRCNQFVEVPATRTMTDAQVAALRELRSEHNADTTRCRWDLPGGAMGFTLWHAEDRTPVVTGLITASGKVVTDATVTL